MGKKIDITGQRFNRWTALYEVDSRFSSSGNRIRIWHCRCDCGNEKDVMMSTLRNGTSKSCGCFNKEMTSMSNSKDLTGKKFGKLTVIERDENSYKWKCICDCQIGLENPKFTYSIGYYLEHGLTKSCGCYSREIASINMKKMVSQENTIKRHNDYIEIIDNNNNSILIDIEDYEKVSQFYWYADKKGYAVTTINGKVVKLHRFIMEVFENKVQVDHINHCKLDNRKCNLRIVNNSQNQMNSSLKSNNKSGVTGVTWHKRDEVWEANITVEGKRIYLGRFNKFEDAVKARKEAEEKYYGEYSYDNSMKISNKLNQ